MRFFVKKPKFDNDLVCFLLSILGFIFVAIVIFMTIQEAKLRLTDVVLVFFYGLALGFLGGRAR